MFCGSLLILWFFPKFVAWLYVPSEWHITTYRYFFAQERKSLHTIRDVIFALQNSHTCLEFLCLPGYFNLFRKFVRWWEVQSAVHVTTKLICLKFYFLKIFLSWRILKHDSLVVITSNATPVSYGSPFILWIFSKYVRWLYVLSEWHITTYRYLFAQERKSQELVL